VKAVPGTKKEEPLKVVMLIAVMPLVPRVKPTDNRTVPLPLESAAVRQMVVLKVVVFA
jgi:hypothetical protein